MEAAKLTSKPVQSKSLSPTDSVLELNIYRACHQRMIWGSSLEPDPPSDETRTKGCNEDKETKTLQPRMFPKGCKKAPDAVLKSTKCNCTSSQCKTNAFSCIKAKLPCSEFCGCQTSGYCNKQNIADEEDSEEEEEDDNEEEDSIMNDDEEC